MRALTPPEYQELREHEAQLEVADDATLDLALSLKKRGLLEHEETEERHYTWLTSKGELALRVHRAYLASLGGA